MKYFIYINFIVFAFLFSCSRGEQETSESKLAMVFGKSLYMENVEGLVSDNITPEDSALLINSYVESWVRDQLMTKIAESNLPPDLNIDKLVAEYRSSLVRYNYEKALLESQMDSVVSEREIQLYFQENMDQFHLVSSILRCYILKIALPVPSESKLEKLLGKSDPDSHNQLLNYCSDNAEQFIINDSTWYQLSDINQQLDGFELKDEDLEKNKLLQQELDNHKYYILIKDVILEQKIAPLSFVQNQIKKIIIHNRKKKLIKNTIEDMYQKELERGNIKIYN